MKIGIISEKKIGLLITTTIFILCSILPILFPIDFETKTVIIVMIIVTYLIVLLCYLMTMEWYILDENSIIVKNIFGTINQVYYKDVSLVYIKKMPVFTKDIKGIPCLLFKDSQKKEVSLEVTMWIIVKNILLEFLIRKMLLIFLNPIIFI